MAIVSRHQGQDCSKRISERGKFTHTKTTSHIGDGKTYQVLLPYDSIPNWHQDNELILHGYRSETNSIRACLASWLYLHNETVNIYSHLLAGLAFLLAQIIIARSFHTNYPKATAVDHIIFAVFLLTAATCLCTSAIYHTVMNYSAQVSQLWLRLDFAGIVILTLGGFVSGIYMTFYCEPTQRKMYWSMIGALGTTTMFIVVSPRFQGRRWRTFRVCTFVGTGLSGLAPLAHGIKLFGFAQMQLQSGMPYYVGEGLLLLLGAFFYTMKVPEIFFPGKFDVFGASHQIFHVLVVLATTLHFLGILSALDYNYHHRICSA